MNGPLLRMIISGVIGLVIGMLFGSMTGGGSSYTIVQGTETSAWKINQSTGATSFCLYQGGNPGSVVCAKERK